MLEIVILGRGGQGAQTAGNQLAQAFFDSGLYVQTFSTYGGARRGTPVTSSLRVDADPIRLRCNITAADAMLCFDASLMDDAFYAQGSDEALIVVNSARPAEAFTPRARQRVLPVDGRAIAARNDMGKVVNSALLGAFAATLGRPGIDILAQVIETSAPAKKSQNVTAAREAYGLMAPVAEEATA
ncbi:MAG: 2-oxoacid:acceptor oxidoreductase family protein [Rhodobacteraceae bacterium]|nr:2-oxoacid:acceptor oxidoreductase family protein [Paracoccaceae bacterium]